MKKLNGFASFCAAVLIAGSAASAGAITQLFTDHFDREDGALNADWSDTPYGDLASINDGQACVEAGIHGVSLLTHSFDPDSSAVSSMDFVFAETANFEVQLAFVQVEVGVPVAGIVFGVSSDALGVQSVSIVHDDTTVCSASLSPQMIVGESYRLIADLPAGGTGRIELQDDLGTTIATTSCATDRPRVNGVAIVQGVATATEPTCVDNFELLGQPAFAPSVLFQETFDGVSGALDDDWIAAGASTLPTIQSGRACGSGEVTARLDAVEFSSEANAQVFMNVRFEDAATARALIPFAKFDGGGSVTDYITAGVSQTGSSGSIFIVRAATVLCETHGFTLLPNVDYTIDTRLEPDGDTSIRLILGSDVLAITSCNAGSHAALNAVVPILGNTGNTTLTCMDNFALNAVGSCSASPPNPPEGTYASCEGAMAGSTCDLVCRLHTHQSGDDPTCIVKNSWSGSPTCEGDPCTTPPAIAHAATASCTNVDHGEACDIECDPGYAQAGSDPICNFGSYGVLPSCVAFECVASPANPPNGSYANCAGVPTGGSCDLNCFPGTTQSGADPTCDAGTSWSGTPTCEPNPCSEPAPVSHGSVAACSNVAHGSSCVVSCDAGFVKTGTDQTCAFGTYVGGAPNCTPYECTASPDDPINGAFEDCSSHSTGEVCELSCIPGFEQVGADAICFAAATWNGSPTCEPASCDTPAAVEHGSFVDCANVNHGESCQLNCEAGYSKSGSDQTCWFGEYLGAAPSCDALGCSAPADPPHGSYECASLSHGSSCELQCDTGYLKSGADPTCLLGNYGSLPTCDPVCGDVPSSGCHQLGAGSSSLLIKNSDDDARDQLKWKWSGGDATDIAEFGDPVLGTTELHLCVYDSSANMQPLAEVIVAPGGTCGALPCWAATGSTGFRYKDKSGALDGAQGIKLKAAAPDRATIQVKAAGASLPTPTLPATGTVTVQLVATGGTGSGSSCWQSVFPAPTANDEGVLKAKVP